MGAASSPVHPERSEGRVERLKGADGDRGNGEVVAPVRSAARVDSQNSELESVSAGHAENHGKTR